ncbi:MAG: hypothetical protein JO356_03330 [Acidobacteria bacterium]|nr:hypothetical protein [Acidobacteriota bacterium]
MMMGSTRRRERNSIPQKIPGDGQTRPVSVAILSWIFIAAGILGLAFHAQDLRLRFPLQYGVWLILLIRVLAIIFGVYMLLGRNWARWGGLLWLAFHVVISFHSLRQLAVHALLLTIFTYFLCTSPAAEYFKSQKPRAA